MHTLVAHSHGTNDTTPGVHDSFSQRDDVVVHLIAAIRAGSDGGGLLEHLSDNGEVGLKVAANRVGNITEALKNGRLELVAQSGAL